MRIAPLLVPLLAACGSGSDPNGPTLLDHSSLRAALGASDVDVVGVTIDPISRERWVLDASSGLYRLTADGAELKAGLDRMVTFDRPPESAFTDVAALGHGRFAMTALNDGFLLDLEASSFSRYFCYVPGEIVDDFPDQQIVQLTRSLTYDPETQLMYAQPQTFEESTGGDRLLSQIGQFSLSGGEGFGWLEIGDEDFGAGALVKIGANEMLLGRESKLYRYDMETWELGEEVDLDDLGVEEIEGMARDPETGNLLIADGRSDSLFEIGL
jgi:hypothetical protein